MTKQIPPMKPLTHKEERRTAQSIPLEWSVEDVCCGHLLEAACQYRFLWRNKKKLP